MTKDTFLVKIIPPNGYSVYRMQFRKRHLAALGALLALVLVAAAAIHSWQLHAAEGNIRALQAQNSAQQEKLNQIDRQADAIGSELRRLQRENQEIRALMGVDRKGGRGSQHAALPAGGRHDLASVQTRLSRLAHASEVTTSETERLHRLALRVLNVRKLAAIARARLIAAIPSLNPVGGTIAASFGWRTNPWPEFHKGVDLAADYGTTVRASAVGTVVSAGWDGGFGIKVDIDHGNGYHTWYAHLSRVAVSAGEHVVKGQPIAFVGSTGESTGPHLHYQVMRDGTAIDPAPFLEGVPKQVLATLPDTPAVP